jgi:uncharacterized protein (TIGR00730 family)
LRKTLKSLCVFCGSSAGVAPRHADAARDMGAALARADVGLVYGGGAVGLMGIVADSVMAAGGTVIGVIPKALADLEVAHHGLTRLHIVSSMHERKAMMADLSDGFIAMAGGIGTLEELFEIWTWGQLGDHQKPVAMLNVGGFYDPLIGFLDTVVDAGFFRPQHRAMLVVDDEPARLIDRMRDYRPPHIGKWIGPDNR